MWIVVWVILCPRLNQITIASLLCGKKWRSGGSYNLGSQSTITTYLFFIVWPPVSSLNFVLIVWHSLFVHCLLPVFWNYTKIDWSTIIDKAPASKCEKSSTQKYVWKKLTKIKLIFMFLITLSIKIKFLICFYFIRINYKCYKHILKCVKPQIVFH